MALRTQRDGEVYRAPNVKAANLIETDAFESYKVALWVNSSEDLFSHESLQFPSFLRGSQIPRVEDTETVLQEEHIWRKSAHPYRMKIVLNNLTHLIIVYLVSL